MRLFGILKNMRHVTPYILLALLIFSPLHSVGATPDTVRDSIEKKIETIKELEEKISVYKKAIAQKQKEAATLSAQKNVLEQRIEKTTFEVESTKLEIDAVSSELSLLELAIENKSIEIDKRQKWLSSLMRAFARADSVSNIEELITSQSVSEIITNKQEMRTLSKEIAEASRELSVAQKTLENKKTEEEEKKNQLKKVRAKLEQKRMSLGEERNRKNKLIEETKNSEKKFATLQEKLKREARQIEAEVFHLEEQMRAKLKDAAGLKDTGPFGIIWPVQTRYVTARFHDPEYPFRHIFEHPGTDIRAGQGTEIKAAASGYVARAKDAGMGYSYVLLLHSNGFSTLYGHVSQILVTQGAYVQQGSVIAKTGGTPGTPGAGPFVTGPHLHFEVRHNGIPQDAEKYLP